MIFDILHSEWKIEESLRYLYWGQNSTTFSYWKIEKKYQNVQSLPLIIFGLKMFCCDLIFISACLWSKLDHPADKFSLHLFIVILGILIFIYYMNNCSIVVQIDAADEYAMMAKKRALIFVCVCV